MEEPMIVRKHSAAVPMSFEMAIDAGAMTEEEARAQGWAGWPPAPKFSRRYRFACWRYKTRERWGRRIGSWIAGLDLSERDDYG